MYTIVNQLHFSKPVDELRAITESEGVVVLSQLPGFVDFKLVKVAKDRAIVLIFWEDQASAENGSKTFGPTWFAKNYAPFLASEQQRSGGEVIVQYKQE